jgi:hypothetical protein
MKNSKAILLAIFTSVFAVLTVVNMSLASPKSAGENTLDMLEIMTRAFDESERGVEKKCVLCRHTWSEDVWTNVGTHVWEVEVDLEAMTDKCIELYPLPTGAVMNINYNKYRGTCVIEAF